MLSLAIVLALQTSQVVDASNLALTSCVFAVMRTESSKGSSAERFSEALERGCRSEEADMRRDGIANLVARGRARNQAEAETDELLAKVRADLVKEYARFAALGLIEQR